MYVENKSGMRAPITAMVVYEDPSGVVRSWAVPGGKVVSSAGRCRYNEDRTGLVDMMLDEEDGVVVGVILSKLFGARPWSGAVDPDLWGYKVGLAGDVEGDN